MANPRELDKRRKSIRNIRKITRTMELIATARFKKAMDRASAAAAYTEHITRLVADLTQGGLTVSHPLLAARDEVKNATLLVLSANRGLCGGYNSSVLRASLSRWTTMQSQVPQPRLEVSGKRGAAGFEFRDIQPHETYFHFEDKPTFAEVEVLANRYLDEYVTGKLDRLDVAYMRFESASRQHVAVETLLPLGALTGAGDKKETSGSTTLSQYEFLPSPESILEEIVPTSFKVKLFKCFLDAAVSEQIARRVAMKAATENAGDLIRQLTREYNRARQSRITSELMDVIGGVNAIS